MAYGGYREEDLGTTCSMETGSIEQDYIHFLDTEEHCDLEYNVRLGDQRFRRDHVPRRIHVRKAALQQRNSAFIDKHNIVSGCILIVDVVPHVFLLLLEYVYKGFQEFNFNNLHDPDEINHLVDAALHYRVRNLVSECIGYFRIQGMRQKSIFWVLEHSYHENSGSADFRNCVQKLSEMHLDVTELQNAHSLRNISHECLYAILDSSALVWNVQKRFCLVHEWTKRQCQTRGIPYNAENVRIILGDTINHIGIERLGCSDFMNIVFNTAFLTRDTCIDHLRRIFQHRHAQAVNPGTINADHRVDSLGVTFSRFAPGYIRSGKQYGVRHDRGMPRPRRRRRHVSQSNQESQHQQSQIDQAAAMERERRLANAIDMATIRDREVGAMDLDQGFGLPNQENEERRRRNQDYGIADSLSFMCSHDSVLKEIHVYGVDGGNARYGRYHIELKVLEEGESVYSNNVQLDTVGGNIRTYPIKINRNIDISKDKVYTIYMVMNGPSSNQGVYGNVEVAPPNADNMTVIFITNEMGLNGSTNRNGQFPAIVLEKKRVMPSRR